MTTATDRRGQVVGTRIRGRRTAAPSSSAISSRSWQLGSYYAASAAASAGFPTFAVDYSSSQWASHPYSWTNVPAGKIRSLSISRGRSNELATMNAGSMDVVLASTDRAYDPQHASLKTGSPVRVTCTIGSNVYTLFSGYADSWDPDEDLSDNDGSVTLAATDAFKMLSRTELRGYQATVLRDAPAAYYRLGESSGSTMVDAMGRHDGVYVGASTAVSSLVAGGDSAREFDGTDDYARVEGLTIPFANDASQPVTLEFWFQADTLDDPTYFAHYTGNDFATLWATRYVLVYWTGSTLIAEVNRAASGSDAAKRVEHGFVNDGEAHHVAAVWSGSALTLYLDGVSVGTASDLTVQGAGREATSLQLAANVGFAAAGFDTAYAAVRLDEVALYDVALTAAQIARHYQAGTFWNTETTSDRVDRVLDLIGWPATARGVETGQMRVGVQDSSVSALTALRSAEEAEQGTLFISAAGSVAFFNRDHTNALASSATISDAGTISSRTFPRRFNEAFLVNEVVVTWDEDAAPVIARDEASILQYGLVSTSISAPLSTRAEAVDIAYRKLAVYAEPTTRVEGVEVIVASQNTVPVEDIIGLELGALVTVVRTPLGTGSTVTMTCRVEGIRDVISQSDHVWRRTLMLSPAQTIPWWRVGDSGDAGNLGTFRIN